MDVNDIVGKKFGRLKVIRLYEKRNSYYYYLCKCDCGNETVVCRSSLIYGFTKSCGCLAKELKYGNRKNKNLKCTKEYKILYRRWGHILDRCTNPKCPNFTEYGGRGITVCREWLDFENFYNWSIHNGFYISKNPYQCTIDRIDNDKGYNPNNCRWVNNKQQSRNRRNNVMLTFNNQTFCISEWAERTKISRSAICHRLERGWSIEKALTTPILK